MGFIFLVWVIIFLVWVVMGLYGVNGEFGKFCRFGKRLLLMIFKGLLGYGWGWMFVSMKECFVFFCKI